MYVQVDSGMHNRIVTRHILYNYGCSTASCKNVWHLKMEKRVSSFYLASIALYREMSAMKVSSCVQS